MNSEEDEDARWDENVDTFTLHVQAGLLYYNNYTSLLFVSLIVAQAVHAEVSHTLVRVQQPAWTPHQQDGNHVLSFSCLYTVSMHCSYESSLALGQTLESK
jgi:hypothetical protein